MKVTVNFASQGRLLEGSLFLPEKAEEVAPTLLFEGSMTGATTQVTEYLAQEISKEGFVCLIIDHSYYGEEESAALPWESPVKRIEDIKAALSFLSEHAAVDKEKIVGVGVSVGAEFMAQVCRETNWCKGLVMVQGPFDDSQNLAGGLDIPTIVVDENHLDAAVDEIVLWVRTLLEGRVARDLEAPRFDWSQLDK